jgi:predicted ATPase/DNA-binding XRE family transcriptional regulator
VLPTFGDLLRQYRVAAGYSQEHLAAKARISVESVGALERGVRRAPYRDTVALLVAALELGETDRRELVAAADRGRARATAKPSTRPFGASRLPIQTTSFVGRTDEMSAITRLLESNRLVTVTGSGGVGKTRIVLELASRSNNPRWREAIFVDLSPLNDGSFIAGAIAAAVLGSAATASSMESLIDSLRAVDALVIIDNCEHLVNDVAHDVSFILQACENISFLATSREQLGVAGESVYRLPSLPFPPGTLATAEVGQSAAVDLFMQRSESLGSTYQLNADGAVTIAEICRRLDGIPLAIELAAARASTLGLANLLVRLSSGLTLTGPRHLPARQQTMLATIVWSYDLLDLAEQLLLTRLSIFVGGFTLDAAEVVCIGDDLKAPVVAELLSSLVNKSLVSITTLGEYRRYGMLDSVRTFALGRLTERGEIDKARDKHAQWVASFGDWVEAARMKMPNRRLRDEVDPELENARAALEWCARAGYQEYGTIAGRIVGGLRTMWLTSGRKDECRRWAEDAIEAVDEDQYPEVVARILRALIQAVEGASMPAWAERALVLYERIGDRIASAQLQTHIAHRHACLGQTEAAARSIDDAARFFAENEAYRLMPYLSHLETRSMIRMRQGRLEDASADVAEGIVIAQRLGDDEALVFRIIGGSIEFAAGNAPEAERLIRAVIERPQLNVKHHLREIQHGSGQLACIQALCSNFEDAKATAKRYLALFEQYVFTYEAPIDLIATLAFAEAVDGNTAAAAMFAGWVAKPEHSEGFGVPPMLGDVIERLNAVLGEKLTANDRRRFAEAGARMSTSEIIVAALQI